MSPRLIWLILAVCAGAASASDLPTAERLYAERKDAEAQAILEQLLRATPDNPDVLLYLGRLAMRARDSVTAIKHFERAVQLQPDNSVLLGELGGAYGSKAQNAGLIEKASLAGKSRKALERAVELDPANLDARSALVQFYSQAPSMMGGGMDKAHAQADVVMRLDPVRGRGAKAGLLVRERRFAEAFELYEQQVQDRPDDYAALYQIGRLAAETGERVERGLEALRACLQLPVPPGQPGQAAAHWRIGNLLERQGDVAGARRAYEAALALEPEQPQAKAALRKLPGKR